MKIKNPFTLSKTEIKKIAKDNKKVEGYLRNYRAKRAATTPTKAPPEAMMAGAALVVDEVAAEPVLVLEPLLDLVAEEPVGAAPVSVPEDPEEPVPVGAAAVSVLELAALSPPAAPVASGVPLEVTK